MDAEGDIAGGLGGRAGMIGMGKGDLEIGQDNPGFEIIFERDKRGVVGQTGSSFLTAFWESRSEKMAGSFR